MKLLSACAICLCVTALSGCASPDQSLILVSHMDQKLAQDMDTTEQGETLTGSRIPSKSTSRLLRRVGNTEYKAASQNGSINPKAFN